MFSVLSTHPINANTKPSSAETFHSLFIDNDIKVEDPVVYELEALQYNEVVEWDNSFLHFNCYAYAIGETDLPEDYSENYVQYEIGDFSEPINFNVHSNIEFLANAVKEDLIKLGYKHVIVTPNQPAVLQDNQTLIAIRRSYGDQWYHNDYHFMRYNPEDGYWYHKPGRYAVLRYLHHPEDMYWINEYAYPSDYDNPEADFIFEATDRVYTSEVYYIIFSEEHLFEYFPAAPLYGMKRHYEICFCGVSSIKPCIGYAAPGEKTYCYYCGQELNDGLFF